MSLEEMFALPHQKKCLAVYERCQGIIKELYDLYQHIGNDDDLFKFQSAGIEAILAVELNSIDIRNDLNAKLTCTTETVPCDCAKCGDCDCEDETVYHYTDENGEPAEWMYQMGTCHKK